MDVYVFGRSKSKLEELLIEYPRIKGIFQWDLRDETLTKLYQDYLLRNNIASIVDVIGRGYPNPIPFLSLNEMQDMIDSNLVSQFTILKSSLVPFKHKERGRMIFFNSIVSFRPNEGASGYVASKMGLRGLLESARYELRMGFKEISLHGLYMQNVARIQMKTAIDSVFYLLNLPYGTQADIIVDG